MRTSRHVIDMSSASCPAWNRLCWITRNTRPTTFPCTKLRQVRPKRWRLPAKARTSHSKLSSPRTQPRTSSLNETTPLGLVEVVRQAATTAEGQQRVVIKKDAPMEHSVLCMIRHFVSTHLFEDLIKELERDYNVKLTILRQHFWGADFVGSVEKAGEGANAMM